MARPRVEPSWAPSHHGTAMQPYSTARMVRHAAGESDEPVDWIDSLLTFNTSCWNCHVSQLSVNYDAGSNAYSSSRAEPVINCETCHGPGEEHIRVCIAAMVHARVGRMDPSESLLLRAAGIEPDNGEGVASPELYGLPVRIHQSRGQTRAARDVCLRAAHDANLPAATQAEFARMAEAIRR